MENPYEDVLEAALDYAEKHFPRKSKEQRHAFANAVAYGQTGWTGGRGGPSMRQWWAEAVLDRDGDPGRMSTDAARKMIEGICFGPLTVDIARMSVVHRDRCFDDPPGETEAAALLLQKKAGR